MNYFRPLPRYDAAIKFLASLFTETIVYPKDRNDDNLFIVTFKRSRDAIFALTRSLQEGYNENITIWLPKFYCWEIAAMLNNDKVIIKFYDIDDNFNPNWKKLETIDIENNINIFCLVSFFGKISNITNARSFVKENNMILLFDETHSAIPLVFPNKQNEYMIWSPYKHLPTPDGAFLYVSKKFNISGLTNYLNHIPTSSKLSNFKSDFLWLLKSYIVRFFKKRIFTASSIKANNTIDVVAIQKIQGIKLGISRFDFQQIENSMELIEPRLSSIYEDYDKIIFILNKFVECEKFPKVRTGSHLFGIKFKTVNEVKLVFDILRKLALPAVRWPEQDYFQLFREELLTSEVINLINLHIYIVTVDIYSGSKVSIDDIEFVKLEKELNATFKTRKN